MFKVQKICGFRYNQAEKRNEYLVKWANYSTKHNSWEPESNLRNCQYQINRFKKTQEMKEINNHFKKSKSGEISEQSQGEEVNEKQILFPRIKKGKHWDNIKQPIVRATTWISSKNHAPSEQLDRKKRMKILKVSLQSNGEKLYQIEVNKQVKWVDRSFLYPTYSEELVIFYEDHLKLK